MIKKNIASCQREIRLDKKRETERKKKEDRTHLHSSTEYSNVNYYRVVLQSVSPLLHLRLEFLLVCLHQIRKRVAVSKEKRKPRKKENKTLKGFLVALMRFMR